MRHPFYDSAEITLPDPQKDKSAFFFFFNKKKERNQTYRWQKLHNKRP